MNHFAAGNWFDFVRGTLLAEPSASIRDHLESGCSECCKAFEMWQAALESAKRETDYCPPPHAVRFVKAAYAAAESRWGWLPQLARMARLVFDSSRQLSTAAVRGSMPSSRHLLHQAEPFVIDLRVESEPAKKRVWLMGQILNSKKPHTKIEAVDVVLLSGERLVAKTAANPAGEFEFEFADERGLQLFINIRGQRAIGIVLPDPES
jgi:hypothetical protein